jgi:hypothetical protein
VEGITGSDTMTTPVDFNNITDANPLANASAICSARRTRAGSTVTARRSRSPRPPAATPAPPPPWSAQHANGQEPVAGLLADVNGDLFGTSKR